MLDLFATCLKFLWWNHRVHSHHNPMYTIESKRRSDSEKSTSSLLRFDKGQRAKLIENESERACVCECVCVCEWGREREYLRIESCFAVLTFQLSLGILCDVYWGLVLCLKCLCVNVVFGFVWASAYRVWRNIVTVAVVVMVVADKISSIGGFGEGGNPAQSENRQAINHWSMKYIPN